MLKEQLKSIIRYIAAMHASLYALLCGQQPSLRPWPFQWSAIKGLNKDLRQILPAIKGHVLDFGCGKQPYKHFFDPNVHYVGVDVEPTPGVSIVLAPSAALPFPDDTFDAVLCTQVLEHVADMDGCLAEITRVLKPQGTFVLSVPFIYHLHGRPHGYRRLSGYGVTQSVRVRGISVDQVIRQGGIGGSLAILLLGWLNHQLDANVLTWAVKALLLPAWLPVCLAANLTGVLLDRLDTTDSFYNNVLLLGRRI